MYSNTGDSKNIHGCHAWSLVHLHHWQAGRQSDSLPIEILFLRTDENLDDRGPLAIHHPHPVVLV